MTSSEYFLHDCVSSSQLLLQLLKCFNLRKLKGVICSWTEQACVSYFNLQNSRGQHTTRKVSGLGPGSLSLLSNGMERVSCIAQSSALLPGEERERGTYLSRVTALWSSFHLFISDWRLLSYSVALEHVTVAMLAVIFHASDPFNVGVGKT